MGRNLLKLSGIIGYSISTTHVSSLIAAPIFGLYSEFSQLRIFASIGYHNQASGLRTRFPTPGGTHILSSLRAMTTWSEGDQDMSIGCAFACRNLEQV